MPKEQPEIFSQENGVQESGLMYKFLKHKKEILGLKIVEDVGFNPKISSIKDIEPIPLIRGGATFDDSFLTNTLSMLAKEKNADFGQSHLEYILNQLTTYITLFTA